MTNIRTEFPSEPVVPLPTDEEIGWWYVVVPEADTNLMVNPSFEVNTTGWSGNAGGETLAVDRTRSTRGAACLKVTPVANTSSGTIAAVTLVANTVHTVMVDVWGALGIPYQVAMYNGTSIIGYKRFTGAGKWTHVVLTVQAGSITANYVIVQKNSSASTAVFYVDGVCTVARPYITTYLDGDQEGCLWSGTKHGSISTRNAYSRAGGRVVPLQQYNFYVTSVLGGGLAPQNPVAVPAGLTGGATYQRSIPLPRDLTLIGRFVCRTAYELHVAQRSLTEAIKPTSVQSPVRLIFQPAIRGTAYGDPLQIDAVYVGGMEGAQSSGSIKNYAITFRIYLPSALGRSVYDGGAGLNFSGSVSVSYILQRSVSGLWGALGSGVNGAVEDIIRMPDGTLVVVGSFALAGGIANTSFIARWDGTSWTALGTGANNIVYAVALGPDGSLYAVGSFTSMGGVANTNHVAKWNGSVWSALGTGTNGDVFSVTVGTDGYVYIGGFFGSAGGVANTNNVAYWNGSTWVSLGTGGANGTVRVVAFGPDQTLYIGGAFTTVNAISAIRIAHLTATGWTGLSTGANNDVYRIVFGLDGTVYVGGTFTVIGGITTNYVAKWNGSQFSYLTSFGLGQPVTTMLTLPDGRIMVGGSFGLAGGYTVRSGLAIWDGSAWQLPDLLAPGTPPAVQALDYSNGQLTIGLINTGTATIAGITTLTNLGNLDTYPTVVIKGPGILIQLINFTTGDTIYFNLTLLDGETVTLVLGPNPSFIEKSLQLPPGMQPTGGGGVTTPGNPPISLSSNFRGNILNTILPGSNLLAWRLVPGANSVSLYMESTSGNTLAVAYWRNMFDSLAGAGG